MATYTVKAGDSLSKIARDVLGNMSAWPQIAQINNIATPYVIYPGQVLQLPGGAAGAPSAFPVPVGTVPIAPPRAPAPPVLPGAPGAAGGILDFVKKNWIWLSLAGVGVAMLVLAPGDRSK